MTADVEMSEDGAFLGKVEGPDDLRAMPEEYRRAVLKIALSHSVNERAGAEAFDEPAILLARKPYEKWLACRIAMEEYGHHLRFYKLAVDAGGDPDAPRGALTIFSLPQTSWYEFVVGKAFGDLAELVQVDDLVESTYTPLAVLSKQIMPEERFHCAFGRTQMLEALNGPDADAAREVFQTTVDRFVPVANTFFGRSSSTNSVMYRRWGLKKRTNDEMRADYHQRASALAAETGLTMPELDLHWDGDPVEVLHAVTGNPA